MLTKKLFCFNTSKHIPSVGVTMEWVLPPPKCNCSAESCCASVPENTTRLIKVFENGWKSLFGFKLIFSFNAAHFLEEHWLAKFPFNLCKSPHNGYCCKVLHTVSQLKQHAWAQSSAPFRFHSAVAAREAWHQGGRMNNRCVLLHPNGWIIQEGARRVWGEQRRTMTELMLLLLHAGWVSSKNTDSHVPECIRPNSKYSYYTETMYTHTKTCRHIQLLTHM